MIEKLEKILKREDFAAAAVGACAGTLIAAIYAGASGLVGGSQSAGQLYTETLKTFAYSAAYTAPIGAVAGYILSKIADASSRTKDKDLKW